MLNNKRETEREKEREGEESGREGEGMEGKSETDGQTNRYKRVKV